MVSVQRVHFQTKAVHVADCHGEMRHPSIMARCELVWGAVVGCPRCGRWFVHTAPVCHSRLPPPYLVVPHPKDPNARRPPSSPSARQPPQIHPRLSSCCPIHSSVPLSQRLHYWYSTKIHTGRTASVANQLVDGIPNPLPLPTAPAPLQPARPLSLQDHIQPISPNSLCTRIRPPCFHRQHLPLATQC